MQDAMQEAVQQVKDEQLTRGMGLWQSTAANMLEMIGIGPFVTIPIILGAMGGPQAMIGWVFGLVIAICDGLIWAELAEDDVIEVPCSVNEQGAQPRPCGTLPTSVAGLVQAVKEYERLTIRAAVERSADLARLALLAYPLVGQWQPACELVDALLEAHPAALGYLKT